MMKKKNGLPSGITREFRGRPMCYGWVVQYVKNLNLGWNTDTGAFTYINVKHGVMIEEDVQIALFDLFCFND